MDVLVRLLVSTADQRIGTVKLADRSNPWWIPLIPIGFVADAAILPPVAVALTCLAPLDANLCVAMGVSVLDDEY